MAFPFKINRPSLSDFRTPGIAGDDLSPVGMEEKPSNLLGYVRRNRPAAPATPMMASPPVENTQRIEFKPPTLRRPLPQVAPESMRVAAPTVTAGPTVGMPSLAAAPQTRSQQLEEAKDIYMAGYQKPQGFLGRLKALAKPTLEGFAQGASSGGGLGAALGGAAGGAGFGAINPRGVREREFERRIKPQILEKFALQDQERAAQEAARKGALEDRFKNAQIENIQSEIKDRERGKPQILSPGSVALDPSAKQVLFQAPFPPQKPEKPPSIRDVDLDETGREGTVDQIAQDSYEGRGGDDYVKSQLSPNVRQVLDKGTISSKSGERSASPEEITDARRQLDKAIRLERNRIRTETNNTRQQNIARKRGDIPSTSVQPMSTSGKATLGSQAIDFIAQKIMQSKPGLSIEEARQQARQRASANGYNAR